MPTGTPATINELDPAVRAFMRQNASKGGKAGTGESKRRGGASFYKNLSRKAAIARKKKKRERVKLAAVSSRVVFA